jgi:hypothetical protein
VCLSIGGSTLIRRVLQNVPHSLPGPNSLSSRGYCTCFLQLAAHFSQGAAVASDPGKNLLNYSCLFSHWFEPGLTSAFPNRDIAVSEWSVGHHVERSALCGMLFATSAPLHDLGSLIFSDNALHLQEQVIFGALTERPVQEHQLDTAPPPLVEEKNLIRVVAGQAVGRVDVDAVNGANRCQVAQPIQSWADPKNSQRDPHVGNGDELAASVCSGQGASRQDEQD